MLAPDYYPEFKCIGPECTDSCCDRDWRVWIDRDTYYRLKANRQPDVAALVGKYLQRTPTQGPQSRKKYAVALLREGGRCGFLGDDRLCQIQKQLGEDALPAICNAFPRTVTQIGRDAELSLTVSCPEAARIILTRREPIRFVDLPEDRHLGKYEASIVELGNGRLAPQVADIRAVCLAILQCRAYPVDARMLLLGEFVSGLSHMIATGREDAIGALCADAVGYLTGDRDYLPAYSRYAVNIEEKVRILGGAVVKLFEQRTTSLFSVFVGGFIEGLGLGVDKDLAGLTDAYRGAYERVGRRFLEEHAHVFENYIVNFAFGRVFPFSLNPPTQVYAAYQQLALCYGILKLIAVGIAAHPAGAEEKELVAMIQSFSGWAEHAPPAVEAMLKDVAERGGNQFPQLATLLREQAD